MPAGQVRAVDCKHACELVAFIKEQKPHFCVGVAGYPEGHPEAESLDRDIECLKLKVDVGADFIITQLFFDNQLFFTFLDKCKKAKIIVPIIPGLMPITSLKQLKKMTEMCGASIPVGLLKKLELADDNKEEVQQIGVEQAVGQARDLLAKGVHGLHFFVARQWLDVVL